LSEASPQFTETFTDIDGKRHSTTIPKGKISSAVWQRLLERKASVSNSHFVELMENIAEPFVTAIRDRKGSKAAFYDGRLFLTGDALALCRPHSGSSTSQAAFQAQELLKVMKGEITPQEWEETCFREAAKAAKYSLAMAQFFCTGKITSDTRKVAEVEASR
jgi:2-polyprenyl-6-methoxyphenol hydroxylase-like FAD-dependent oxidoreductase